LNGDYKLTQKIEKQLSDHELKHESRDVQVTNTDGQTRDRLIEINSNLIRMLQEAWQQRWNRLPNQTELQELVDSWIHEEVLYRESLNRGRPDYVSHFSEYIEVFYNRKRLHSALNYSTPFEYESLFEHRM
jgi:murein tripeptide amidase MpaA